MLIVFSLFPIFIILILISPLYYYIIPLIFRISHHYFLSIHIIPLFFFTYPHYSFLFPNSLITNSILLYSYSTTLIHHKLSYILITLSIYSSYIHSYIYLILYISFTNLIFYPHHLSHI